MPTLPAANGQARKETAIRTDHGRRGDRRVGAVDEAAEHDAADEAEDAEPGEQQGRFVRRCVQHVLPNMSAQRACALRRTGAGLAATLATVIDEP